MGRAWVLVADSMDYGGTDTIIGVFETLEEGQVALIHYLQEAIQRHPSNKALLDHDYTLTCWRGTQEVETWTKSGRNAWQIYPT